ncbi:MAG TPA: hypothetical protein PK264_20425, partial [Hyphomicrobiaceae bacterium]|nr:hypothetical protein [Hyphomicrobiaceae bacterium]
MAGRLLSLATRARTKAPMIEAGRCLVTRERGLEGDFRGAKYPRRQVTVLAREDWEAALAELAAVAGAARLPWT